MGDTASEEVTARRRQDLVAFYKSHDPSRNDVEGHVEGLFRRHTFEHVARAVQTKYGSMPEGWEDELETLKGGGNRSKKRDSTLGATKRNSVLGELGDLFVGGTAGPLKSTPSLKKLTQQADNPYATFFRAKQSYMASNPGELSLEDNELVEMLEAEVDVGWSWVKNKAGKEGYVPSSELVAVVIDPIAPPLSPHPQPAANSSFFPSQETNARPTSSEKKKTPGQRKSSGRRSSIKTTEAVLREADQRASNAKMGAELLSRGMASVADNRGQIAKLGTTILKSGMDAVSPQSKDAAHHQDEEETISQREAQRRRSSVMAVDSPRSSLSGGAGRRRSTISNLIPSFLRSRPRGSSGGSPRDSKERVFNALNEDDELFEFENPLLVGVVDGNGKKGWCCHHHNTKSLSLSPSYNSDWNSMADKMNGHGSGSGGGGTTTPSSDYYFDSYAHFGTRDDGITKERAPLTATTTTTTGIHEEMLKDQVRTSTYMKAITRNPHLFKNKVVLDVGCGTGILSMFCAKAGAKLVIGVDYSSITEQAQKIVEDNGFKGQVRIVRSKIEEVDLTQLFGVDKVDIIVSEWMGYCLLYEAMLDSVLIARDRWLKPGGLIFPDVANMYAVAIEDADYKDQKIGFWNDVYGFDFSSIKPLAMKEPLVDVVDAKQVMTKEAAKVYQINLNTVTKEQLDFTSSFTLEAGRDDYVHGLVLYFDVVFSKSHKQYGFSTGPEDAYTHWKQTTLYLNEPLVVVSGERMVFNLSCAHNASNPRELDLCLSYEFHGKFQNVTRKEDEYRLR